VDRKSYSNHHPFKTKNTFNNAKPRLPIYAAGAKYTEDMAIIAILIAMMATAAAEIDLIRITNGVTFRKIENNMIIYEHIIPIMYREPILTNENTIEELTKISFEPEKNAGYVAQMAQEKCVSNVEAKNC